MNVMSEISVIILEYLDLLVNYFGLEFKIIVENIWVINLWNLEKVVNNIWECLDCEYGSVEIIELLFK